MVRRAQRHVAVCRGGRLFDSVQSLVITRGCADVARRDPPRRPRLRYLIVPSGRGRGNRRATDQRVLLPDFNPHQGRRWPPLPLGSCDCWNKEKIKKVRILSANVEYQLQGLGLVLMHGLLPALGARSKSRVFLGPGIDSLSRGSLERADERTKTYRLYDLDPQKQTAVEIREVTSRDLDQFIRVPWRIYPNDLLVPPLLVDVKEFLDRATTRSTCSEATSSWRSRTAGLSGGSGQ